MSSFAKELGKSFVRSTVNQVGRDTGRVISNELYGDAHAAPRRIVGGTGNSGTTTETIAMTDEEFNQYCIDYRQNLEEQGYKISPLGLFTEKWHIPFYIIFGLIPLLGIIGTIVFIYKAIPSLKGNTIFYNDNVVEVNAVADRRYKGGYRVEGANKTTKEVQVIPTYEEKSHNIKIGIIYLIIGIALIVFRFAFFAVLMSKLS